MRHLLPLYLALAVLPGIAALTVLSALASRLKNKALTLYLVAYGCFTVSVLVNLVMFYLGINISEEITPGVFALILVSMPFSVLMHTTLPLAVNEITRPPGKRLVDRALVLLAVVQLVLYSTPLTMSYSREAETIFFGPIYDFVAAIQILLIGYSIGLIVVRRSAIEDPAVRRYILTMGIIIAFFLPAVAYDQFFFLGVESINTVPVAVILSPFFYAVLSLATIFFGTRFWIASANPGGAADPQLQLEEKTSLDVILKSLADKSSLSERELTIIPLIADGLGNKQIALELHISPKTVGNHIYNIYRKLNIASRYELLALLK